MGGPRGINRGLIFSGVIEFRCTHLDNPPGIVYTHISPMPMRFSITRIINYQNKRFHSLTLITRLRVGGKGVGAIWIAQCDCGETREVAARMVANGRIKSCGKCQLGRDLTRLRRVRTDRYTKEQRKAFRRYMKTADRRHVPFTIPLVQFFELTKEDCTLCHKPARESDTGVQELSLIEDRQGYTPENTVASCKRCRDFQGRHNLQEVLEFCADVVLVLNKT